MTKGVDCGIGEGASYEVEGEIEVGQGKIGEEQADKLVDEFNVEEDLAANGMICVPDLSEVDERVDCGKEGTVQPSPTLGNEFGNSI
jgi:hypothetical protein